MSSNQQNQYTSVIVIGAGGNCGLEIAKAILEHYPQVNLTLHVRNEEKVASLKEKGANVIVGDILSTSEEELVNALSGKEVVITALAAIPELLLQGQLKLIEASKKAGVKKYLPTTYGLNLHLFKPEESMLNDAKFKITETIKQSGLEWTQVNVGIFAHMASFLLFNKFDTETKTVHYNGDLSEKVDVSFLEDVGKFVAKSAIRKDVVGDINVASDTLTVKEIAHFIHGENIEFKQDQTAADWIKSIQERIAEKLNSPSELFPILLEQLRWTIISGRRVESSNTNLFQDIKPRLFKTINQQ